MINASNAQAEYRAAYLEIDIRNYLPSSTRLYDFRSQINRCDRRSFRSLCHNGASGYFNKLLDIFLLHFRKCNHCFP